MTDAKQDVRGLSDRRKLATEIVDALVTQKNGRADRIELIELILRGRLSAPQADAGAALLMLAEKLELSAHEGSQSLHEAVVAMAMQDAKDAEAVRRTIGLLARYGGFLSAAPLPPTAEQGEKS